MKKILQLLTATILTFTAVQMKGQVTAGNLSADWTLTDINGVSYHLDSILNAGKTVFIDISATWCAPCWAYHNSGAFENLWVNHGPAGGTGVSSSTTNDCMVFFIEGDGTTNHACLIGDNTNCSGGSASQGDWTAGVSHPIIDPTTTTNPTVTAFDANYNLAYFPTCVMICPDRSMTEVDQFTTAQLYAAKAACSSATAAVDAEMIKTSNPSLASCDSVTPTFRIGNVGTTPLTSATIKLSVDGTVQKTINWTGNLATYASILVTGSKVGSSVAATHTISATVSNPNGGVDPTSGNNSTSTTFIRYSTIGGSFISESFESAGIPTSWIITAGGAPTWNDATVGAGTSSASAVLAWFGIAQGQIDYMALPPQSFANATVASLTFDVSHAQFSASDADKLEVQASTDCGATWVSRYSKSGPALATAPVDNNTSTEYAPTSAGNWRHESVNLNVYAGQSNVLFRFKGTSDYGNDVYVDNVNFSPVVAGINENEMANNNVNVYPNPVTNNAIVNFSLSEPTKVSITLVNALGQLVINKDLGMMNTGIQNYSLDAASLSNGLYFLNIKIGNSNETKKIAINR